MDLSKLDKITLPVIVDTKKVDDAMNKIQRLNELLREARSLVDELASLDLTVNLELDV